MERKKKNKITTIIFIVICIIGLSSLLYPTVSNYFNTHFTVEAVSRYVAKSSEIKEEDYKEVWQQAIDYNTKLRESDNMFTLDTATREEYYKCLDILGDGQMGYIEIPKMGVTFSIYHGTSDDVLNIAVGHLEWSSLPTGGIGTHCCLSAHRGLAKAKLFTDLDMLREGDEFSLNILNETLLYEVDQIRTVEPDQIADLAIDPNKDYCTLITCTPYGINTHRLLVRGHRIELKRAEVHVVSEAIIIDPLICAPVMACPLLFILLMMVIFKKPESKKKKPDLKETIRAEINPENGGEI